MILRLRAFALTALLAACGGGSGVAPTTLPDTTYDLAIAGGRRALEAGRADQAARLYASALARARERDDAVNIAEAGTGRATALLAQGRAREALTVVRSVRAELVRRRAAVPPTLLLVEATTLYRTGDLAGADREAAAVQDRRAEDADAAARASFLRGLIAARRGDAAGLETARAALGAPDAPGLRADAAELTARARLLAGDAAGAREAAARAAEDRRAVLDYRGVTRALALEAEAAERAGNTREAADLYQRAARSAGERNEAEDARRWTAAARRLGAGR